MKPSDALRGALYKLSLPECWIQFDYARTIRNQVTDPRDRDAICWCSSGAIMAVTGLDDGPTRVRAREYLFAATDLPGPYGDEKQIVEWNDDVVRTHAEIVKTFARAAELAERDGQ